MINDDSIVRKTHLDVNETLVSILAQQGYEHLQEEGFSDQHIQKMADEGVRWVGPSEAKKLGFRWRNEELNGLYFPSVGHLKPFPALKDSKGKTVKYLFSQGWKAVSKGETVETEGAKDAFAGTLIGGIPTFAKPSTTFYKRPEFQNPDVKVALYDSDAWTNPGVLMNLVGAAIHQKCKVQAVPDCPGFTKSGLVEYFKAGHTAEDYKKLIRSALRPQEFLTQAPQRWSGLETEQKEKLLQTVVKSAAKLEWSEVEKIDLLGNLAQATGETQKRIQALLKSEVSLHTQKANIDNNPKVKPECQVGNETLEVHLLHRLFLNGEKPYITLDDAFYSYTGEGYWEAIPEGEIRTMIAKGCEEAWKCVETKEGVRLPEFRYGSEREKQSTLRFCADRLARTPKDNFHLRCFKNGTVNMETGELREHRSEDLITCQINGEYKPTDVAPPVLAEFVKSAFGEKLLEFWRAHLYMYLDPSCFYGKFVHIIGDSGSGKGTVIRLVQGLYNDGAVASLSSFTELIKKEDRHSNLTGASLCCLPDLVGYQQGLQSFYELVDNGKLQGRALFSSSSYCKEWGIRFISASVHALKIENAGEGWGRRVNLIQTLKRTKKTDRHLGKKLAAEIPQIICWVLGMDKERRDEIIENPAILSPSLAQLSVQAGLAGDAVKSFLDDCFCPDNDGLLISNTELYLLYKAYCQATGNGTLKLQLFTEQLQSALPSHYTARKQEKGVRMPAGLRGIQPHKDVFEKDLSGDRYICHVERTSPGSLFVVDEPEEEAKEEAKEETFESTPEAKKEARERCEKVQAAKKVFTDIRSLFYSACTVEEMKAAVESSKEHLSKDQRKEIGNKLPREKKDLVNATLNAYPALRDLNSKESKL